MALDMNTLMKDPSMIMAMNMLAQSGFQPGANGGSRLGKAMMGSAAQLQDLERQSANASYRNKMMEMQEERNRLAAQMQKDRLQADKDRLTETKRSNQAKEKLYTDDPKAIKGDDGKIVGYTYGGNFTQPRKLSLEDMLMMNMLGGGPMMPTPSPGGGKSLNDLDAIVANMGKNKPAQAPAQPPLQVPYRPGYVPPATPPVQLTPQQQAQLLLLQQNMFNAAP